MVYHSPLWPILLYTVFEVHHALRNLPVHVLSRPSTVHAGLHNANTNVHLACFMYTVHFGGCTYCAAYPVQPILPSPISTTTAQAVPDWATLVIYKIVPGHAWYYITGNSSTSTVLQSTRLATCNFSENELVAIFVRVFTLLKLPVLQYLGAVILLLTVSRRSDLIAYSISAQ